MNDAQVKHMVDRFLGWKLPDNFAPDGGVSFEKVGNAGTAFEYTRAPVGTNLLTADQAEAMVRHLLDDLPGADEDNCPICDVAFKADDMCLTDIEMGTCHAECLAGSPKVDLETGDELPEGEEPEPFPYQAVA